MDVNRGNRTERRGRMSVASRLLSAVAVAAVMVVGVFVLGRVASNDVMAMALTTVFFVVVAAAIGWLVWRRRELLLPLGATYVLIAGAAGLLLGLPLITDDVVEEDVIRVEATTPSGGGDSADPEAADTEAADSEAADTEAADSEAADPEAADTEPTDTEATDAEATEAEASEATGPTAIASGQFEARVHPGEGTATLIDTGEGSTVLTLTDFATDNGPDLLVYLVPADTPEGSVDGFVDLGTLSGNIGDQQYEVPADVDAGAGWRVVIWCRAFAVNFTEATLA